MRLPIIILCTLCLLSCHSEKRAERSLSQDEYDVYNVVISEILDAYDRIPPVHRHSPRKVFVFYRTVIASVLAGPDSSTNFSRYVSPREWRALFTDFVKILNDTLRLDYNKLKLPSELIFDTHSSNAGEYVYSFGLQMFSRVAFDSARSKAVVFVHVYAEWPSEYMLLLTKTNERWRSTDALFRSFDGSIRLSSTVHGKPSIGARPTIPEAIVNAEDSTETP